MRRSARAACPALLTVLMLAQAAVAAPLTPESEADRLYRQAIDACLEGDDRGYRRAVWDALRRDPDHAPSRAELGYVATRHGWVLAEHAQSQATEDERLAAHRRLRAAASDTRADHERLARWCDREGLDFEARAHWLSVLGERPQHAVALRRLEATWRDGRLVPERLAAELAAETERSATAARVWDRRLARLERAGVGAFEVGLAEFAEAADRDAAQPVEQRVASLADQTTPRLVDRRRRFAEAYLEAAEGLESSEVTASLARFAVFAPDAALREQAIGALAPRPTFDVVPLLLEAFVPPVDSSHRIDSSLAGGVAYEHRLFADGADVDRSYRRRRVARMDFVGLAANPQPDLLLEAALRARVAARVAELEFDREAAEVDAWVAAYNAEAQESNDRVIAALEYATGQSLGSDPRPWWDYWHEYAGYDPEYERPVEEYEETYEETTDYYAPPPPRPRCECFVAGTPVWTRTGVKPIERVQHGELVLARDPHFGGLTYRAVTTTTLREPSPMVEVVAGDETIVATVGHPFWVVGAGWRKASELSEGDALSSVAGPLRVASVRSVGDSPAHNLVVEGAANYYVGDDGVLVHDNTPRRPAASLLVTR